MNATVGGSLCGPPISMANPGDAWPKASTKNN